MPDPTIMKTALLYPGSQDLRRSAMVWLCVFVHESMSMYICASDDHPHIHIAHVSVHYACKGGHAHAHGWAYVHVGVEEAA